MATPNVGGIADATEGAEKGGAVRLALQRILAGRDVLGTAARAGYSLALASSGYGDGSLIRMKRIFLIHRIDHLGASVHRARAPFFLLFALRRLCGGPEPTPSGSYQEIPARQDRL